MKYVTGDSVVEYSVYRKGDVFPEILSLLFTVGEAEQVLYIEHLELANSNVSTALSVMKEFVANFDNFDDRQSCIAYCVESGTNAMSVLMRYVIQQVGFVSTVREIDSPTETLFILRSSNSYDVMEKLEDEMFSFILHAMVFDDDKTRLDLLLKRLGNKGTNELKQYLNFGGGSQTATPQKVVI